jgi:hypothetical protein
MPVEKVAATRLPSASESGRSTSFQRLVPATALAAWAEARAGTVTVLVKLGSA